MKHRAIGAVAIRPRLSVSALWLVAVAYGSAMALTGMWSFQRWQHAFASQVIDEMASLFGVLFAAGCAAWAAFSTRSRARRGWLVLMTGLLAWGAGEAIWCYQELWPQAEETPLHTVADGALLLFPLGAGAALLLLSNRDDGQSESQLILDGVIVGISLFILSWIAVLGDVVRAGGDARLVAVAHLVANVAIATIAIMAWARARPAHRPSLGLLSSGIILIALSDSLAIYLSGPDGYHTGNLIDLGRLAGFGLLALAALSTIDESSVEPAPVQVPSRARLWLPYLPLLLAGGVGLAQVLPRMGLGPFPVMAVTLVLAVLARQFVVLVENQRLLSDVARQAFRDGLTGLANRALFLDRLEQAVERQRRESVPLAVLCLDLDDFKTVNDALGHPAGDELLIRVAGRLTRYLGDAHLVARLGGDEFAVLINGSGQDAVSAAGRTLDAFDSPIVVEGIALTVRPSIGFTFTTAESSRTTVDDLLRQADLAMYAAKRDGGGCVRSFVPALQNLYELTRSRVPAVADPPRPVASAAEPALSTGTPRQTPRCCLVRAGCRVPRDRRVRDLDPGTRPPRSRCAVRRLALPGPDVGIGRSCRRACMACRSRAVGLALDRSGHGVYGAR